MADALVIPPMRTDLTEGDGDGERTAKAWYYYWRGLGDKISAAGGLVTFGSPNDRPNPGDVPLGALYVQDAGAGYVIYELQEDGWHYVGGTHWATVSPDARPTGLGTKDGGYTFRGTDQARTFVWSGTAWVETTPSWYGTHATRPAASTMAAGCLYTETDTGQQVYEVQVVSGSNAWVQVSPQTPWVSDIDGASHSLFNVASLGVGTAVVPATFAVAGRSYLTIKGTTNAGVLELATAVADGDGTLVGSMTYSDPLNSQTDQRLAAINCFRSGTTALNRGAFLFFATKPDGAGAVTERMRIANNGNVGIAQSSPAYKLDVGGDVNVSAGSVYRVNGTPIGVGVTAQSANLAGTTRVLGTNYTNGTSKPIFVTVTWSGAAIGTGIVAYTDSSGAPTTVVAQSTCGSTNITYGNVSFWVLAGNSYRVAGVSSPTLSNWLEWT